MDTLLSRWNTFGYSPEMHSASHHYLKTTILLTSTVLVRRLGRKAELFLFRLTSLTKLYIPPIALHLVILILKLSECPTRLLSRFYQYPVSTQSRL